jgi:steroid delta-isomerase-like uncharacterized protein
MSASLSRETVAGEVVQAVPMAPAFMALARFTYAPGALFGPAAGAGPVVMRVLAGSLAFNPQLPVFRRLGGPTQPREAMAPNVQFEIEVGDQLFVPGDVPHSAKSPGPEQAVMMGVALFRQAPPQVFPPGIGFEPLVIGSASQLPAGLGFVSLIRLALGAGSAEPPATAGRPELRFIESGTVAVSGEGDVAVTPAGAAPGTPPQPLEPGRETTLAQGDGLVIQPGATVSYRAHAHSSLLVAAVDDARVVSSEGKAIARRFLYEIWDRGHTQQIDQVFAADYADRNPLDGQLPGGAGVRQLVDGFRAAFPDLSVSVDLQIDEGTRVANRYTLRGTHRGRFLGLEPTGRPVEITGILVLRIENGLIAESWGYWDQATMLAQIGKAPWVQ